jgi:hypothetical protein
VDCSIHATTTHEAGISSINYGISILFSNISLNYAQLCLVNSNFHNLLLHILTSMFLYCVILMAILSVSMVEGTLLTDSNYDYIVFSFRLFPFMLDLIVALANPSFKSNATLLTLRARRQGKAYMSILH